LLALGFRSHTDIPALKKLEERFETQKESLEQLQEVLGLESMQDAEGNIIQEAPLPVWASFRQRALDTAIAEITKKTDIRYMMSAVVMSHPTD
jgi:hypothetical protein